MSYSFRETMIAPEAALEKVVADDGFQTYAPQTIKDLLTSLIEMFGRDGAKLLDVMCYGHQPVEGMTASPGVAGRASLSVTVVE